MPAGRPTDYTQELGDRICEKIAEGKSMRSVCREEDMPGLSTVFRWIRDIKEFQEQYARACEERTEALSEEILDIADDGINDWMEVEYKDNTVWKVNNEAVQRSRLRVDTRKWIMSKMKPKKYGDKVDVTSGGDKITGNTIVFESFKDHEQDKG